MAAMLRRERRRPAAPRAAPRRGSAAALGPLVGPFQQVEDGIRAAIESMLSGGASPDEALEAAVKEANAAISEYNRHLGR
jgi:ABC-type glycerol-3-phosphate transport system substrate-binding protein